MLGEPKLESRLKFWRAWPLAQGVSFAAFILFSFSSYSADHSSSDSCRSGLESAAKRLKTLQQEGELTPHLVYAGVDKVFRRTFGVPFWVSSFKAGQRIFRRYMEPQYLEEVLRSGHLSAGDCPYVVQSECYREEFPDLVGLFFTTRSYSSKSVGLEADMPFIDFRLPPETEVFRLEPGIYLIPKEKNSSAMMLPIEILGHEL